MLLLLASLASSSDWPTARGPAEGTQLGPGTGEITGLDGGYPVYMWRTGYSSTSYTTGYSAVVDVDDDGRPETLGITRARVYLWDEDGSVLAVSDSVATPYLHGVYDLDGDGIAGEVVIAGNGVGGGVFVFDAATLALLWRSSDPGLNGGGSIAETAVVDTDGDGIPELLWSTSFTGYADYRLLSFEYGFGAPVEVTFPLPTTTAGLLPVVAGAYLGAPGGFLVEQGTTLTWIETADRLDDGAVCSADESRCLRLANQYTGVHAAATSGDRAAFDVDGDGDAEYLSSSYNDLGAVDIGVFDPSRGTTTAEARLWQYRYGNGGGEPLDRFVYTPEGQGFASTAGGSAVVATLVGTADDETDASGAPADDCVDAYDGPVTVVFDASTGRPLAVAEGYTALGTADVDGDGVPEILTADPSETEVSGWELTCEGPGTTGAWNGCADTGCSLTLAWSVAGELPKVLNQVIPADEWHADASSTPVVLDLTGDGVPEVVVDEGADLVAWSIDGAGNTTEIGRYTTGTCGTIGGWTGEGADSWLLLEGTGCHVVLDATLGVVSNASLTDHTQGVGLALAGDVGADVPVVAIANRIFVDPSSSSGMATPVQVLNDTPVRFADLDGNGYDELVAYRQGVDGDWRVAVYEWSGVAFSERWRVTSSQLGGADRNINNTWAPYQFAVGDFDGDGGDDVAFFATDYTRGATNFSDRGTFYFLDGEDGSLLASFVGPPVGVSASYAQPLQAADLCAGTTCPGTDGVDELVFIGSNSVIWYGAGYGYLLGFSIDSTSESMWGDFDGDGEPELGLGAGFTATNRFQVQVVELDGTLNWEAVPGSASGTPYTMHGAADIDEDGALDLFVGGGYGEITAYSGVNGARLDGFPVYLDAGLAWETQPGPMRRVLQPAAGDIDGDGHVEILVAHDDGYLYALDVAPAEGGPALAWSLYLGSPVQSVRTVDADGDGAIEVMVLANDGTARLVDGGETFVDILEPEGGACISEPTLELVGASQDVDEIAVYLQGVEVGRVDVAADGDWSFSTPWPAEGTFRVEAWAVVAEELVASDSISVTHYDDADGDGVSECDGDCDDADPTRYPGQPDDCDGIDVDCDGAISEESDDDGDGFLACEECDDQNPANNPDAEEICDEVDNDCDGKVDEDDVCLAGSYVRGGGGCGCASGGETGGLGLLALAALGLVRRRRA